MIIVLFIRGAYLTGHSGDRGAADIKRAEWDGKSSPAWSRR